MMKPGVYSASHKDYHEAQEWDAIHASDFQQMSKSMAHFRYYKENPPESAVFDFGRMLHLAVLEPDKFHTNCVYYDGIKRGKAWEAFKAENGDRVILKPDEYQQIIDMANAVDNHKLARAIINHPDAVIEQSACWYDQDTGEKMKCRPDLHIPSEGVIADLKGVKDASAHQFSRACANYGYRFQAPVYLDGLNEATGQEYKHFIFICVEKEPPHLVAIYEADHEFIEVGRMQYKELLREYSQCRIEKRWPGYPEKIQELSLPAWAKQID